MRRPIIPLTGVGLDLGSYPLDVNAGVTTGHLKQRMQQLEMLRVAASRQSPVEKVVTHGRQDAVTAKRKNEE